MTPQKPKPGRDLATLRPELAKEANGWDPTTVTAMSNKKVEWICEEGHIWGATVCNRSAGRGCPIHAGRLALAGYNDLATTNPELAREAYGWDPTTVTAMSNKKVEWICEEGHIWGATVCNRSAGRGCPIHAGRLALAGYNDLATTNPGLAKQAHGWDATTVTAMSGEKVDWICEDGHIWSARVVDRSRGSGCPFCCGRLALAEYNDLATINPDLAEQAYGWDPTTLTAMSNKKVEWICEEGHIWGARVKNRSNGGDCPTCNPGGFDPNLPGYLYFIEHLGEDLLQIGISNHPEKRLSDHESRGWTVIEVQGPWGVGQVARDWEQSILKYLRAHGAIMAPDAGIEKFDGYTESWLRESFPVRSLKQLRALVLDEEAAA